MVCDVEVVFLDGVISSGEGKDSKETLLTRLLKGHKPRSDGCVPTESTLLQGQVSMHTMRRKSPVNMVQFKPPFGCAETLGFHRPL